MEEARAQRLAENERILHDANERIGELTEQLRHKGWPGAPATAEFFCACGRRDCSDTIRLSLAEYEAAHRQPHRFVVRKGHENPSVERVVQDLPEYTVVEKLPRYR